MNFIRLGLCIFVALTIMGKTTFGQSQNRPNKSQLIRLIKASIDQDSKKWISIGSGAWISCNQDSTFFKADTIKLYDHINYFYQKSSCCQFIEWTFYKKDKFAQSSSQICEEPPTRQVKSIFYESKYISESGHLFLIVSKNKTSVMKFEVINFDTVSLANNNISNIITLKRIPPNDSKIINITSP